MESAVAELMQENNGGVLVWFMELMWAQAKRDDLQPQPRYYSDFPAIPHTVIFNYSHAQGWFFEPTTLKPTHGGSLTRRRIRRKRRLHLVAHDIFEELSSGFEGKPHEIVAQLVTRQTTLSVALPKITYLTRDDLYQLLFHGTIAEGSVLQKFVHPQGPHHSNPLSNSNATLTVLWQPTYCYVERHVNVLTLGDPRHTPKERGATMEDPKHSHTTALGHNSTTLHCCRRTCNAIAEHVLSVTGLHLRSLTVTMKINTENQLALLFVQRVAVVENERLTPNIGNGCASDDDDDGAEGGDVSMSRREQLMELQRCTSEKQRAYLLGLLPEEEADATFNRIAPRSWMMRRRQTATQRSASRLRQTPALASMSRGSSAPPSPATSPKSSASFASDPRRFDRTITSPALAATRTLAQQEPPMDSGAGASSSPFGSFRTTGSFRLGKGANSTMRDAEAELATKTQGTVIVSATNWNAQPSRVEVALMRDATTDMYPLKKVAHNVSALGLREKYLASIRAASGAPGPAGKRH